MFRVSPRERLGKQVARLEEGSPAAAPSRANKQGLPAHLLSMCHWKVVCDPGMSGVPRIAARVNEEYRREGGDRHSESTASVGDRG